MKSNRNKRLGKVGRYLSGMAMGVCLFSGLNQSCFGQPVLWLKADVGVVTNASGGVTEWHDQSGNGHHAYQSDTNKTPTLAISTLGSCANNGFPVVRFDGDQSDVDLGDYLQSTNNLGLSAGFTSFIVYRKADRTISEEVPALVGVPGDYNDVRAIYIRTSNEMAFSGWGNDYGSGFDIPPDVFRIWTDRLSSDKLDFDFFDTDGVNNFNTSVPTSGLGTPGAGYYVGGLDSEQRNFKGDIAELIFFDTALSETNRVAVEDYLRLKYNLPPFPANPVLWLKADVGVITNANGQVTQWQDQSGNANHASQSDTNKSPVFVNCVINGLPVVSFDGDQTDVDLGDYLQGTNDVGLTAGFTSFIVYRKADRTISEEMPALVGVPGDYDNVRGIYIRTSNEMSFTGWGNDYGSGFDIPPDVFRIWTDRLSSDKLDFDFFDTDGVTEFSTSVPTSGLGDPGAGYYVGGLGSEQRNFQGDIAELIYFDSALTENQRIAVEDYLYRKYDIYPKTWTGSGALDTGRSMHTATLLTNGTVLVTGGETGWGVHNTTELYNISAGTWSYSGTMNQGRTQHTATMLNNGKILVAGGEDGTTYGVNSAELYVGGSWTYTDSLDVNRINHTATLLTNGHVLVAGGIGFQGLYDSVELFNPGTETWTNGPSMGTSRCQHVAARLLDGRVLVAGGLSFDGIETSYPASAEIYTPGSGWSSAGSMQMGRIFATATLLTNGEVLVTGGISGPDYYSLIPVSTAEIYNPSNNTWRTVSSMHTSRSFHTATVLPSGKVLIAGGSPNWTDVQDSAELFDPATGLWTPTIPMAVQRGGHTATLLPNGRVLAVGGGGGYYTGPLTSSELYP